MRTDMLYVAYERQDKKLYIIPMGANTIPPIIPVTRAHPITATETPIPLIKVNFSPQNTVEKIITIIGAILSITEAVDTDELLIPI